MRRLSLRHMLIATALLAVLAGFVLLVRYVHMPAYVVLVIGLALPALVSTSASGVVNALVPGILVVASRRYGVGDHLTIGVPTAPIAQGTVTKRDLYAVTLRREDGSAISVTHAIAATLAVARTKKEEKS